jgi:hypothetical protein
VPPTGVLNERAQKEQTMDELFCENCPCFVEVDGLTQGYGDCRRFPPVYMGDDAAGGAIFDFPPVNINNWCYEGRKIMAGADKCSCGK